MAWIKTDKTNKPKIYGIKRLLSSESPTWERTDSAIGFTATASIGTVSGSSSFDAIYPWSAMKRHTFSTNDVMTLIPAFWYRRWEENGYEYIQISPKPVSKFSKHPGSDKYVGAYRSCIYNQQLASLPDRGAKTEMILSDFRNLAKTKGIGWGIMDISCLSAIYMLFLVEFATYDSQQVLGNGNTQGTNKQALITGGCDDVANLTGRASSDINSDVIYRGVETLYGWHNQYIDGVIINSSTYYVSTNPNDYNATDKTNYTKLSYSRPILGSSSYLTTQMGYDPNMPWCIFPSASISSTSNWHRYICDGGHSGDANNDYSYTMGGLWDSGYSSGLFYSVGRGYNAAHTLLDARLMYATE